MPIKPEQLIRELSDSLHGDIATLGPMPDTATGRRTAARLHDVAQHAPAFLQLLVEPLLRGDDTATALAIVRHCARVHLYARVLDDALDENLPLDRRNLLRIQPAYWRAVYALGAAAPSQLEAAQALIATTVEAVETDDARASPAEWGRKNHHLLLAPLLLSRDSAAYRAAVPGLSALIAVAQAVEEFEQGRLREAAIQTDCLRCLEDWLGEAMLVPLQRHGWHAAAKRLVSEGAALLSKMNLTSTKA